MGNFRIGPYYYWISGNHWEGTRFRFDASTNRDFSKHWHFHGYLAYGTQDKALKGKGDVEYEFGRKPWTYVKLSYKRDLDNGQTFYDPLGSDNSFGYLFRKAGVPYKYQRVNERKFEYYGETNSGFGFGLTAASRQYTPLLNLPGAEFFPVKGGDPLNNFETVASVRYAYEERTFSENFERFSVGSDYPIVELKYSHGFKGVLNSSYTYDKVDLTINDYLKISPYGTLYYSLFAGKVLGNSALPYQMLDLQPGNEWHYYSQQAFNLMNRFEYITDRYAGFNIEHNIGSGLFRFIPLTRKLKWRQLWTAKGLVGDLSDANKQMNFVGDYPFKSLDGKLYLELGTGIDNILKVLRVDFIWRVLPTPLPTAVAQRFGVFFGFHVGL